MGSWLPGYARHRIRRASRRRSRGHRHLLFAVCDHFEPAWRQPPAGAAEERVRRWRDEYPLLARDFRDADGRPPRHTFFYFLPFAAYVPDQLDLLAELVRAGLGEVELHLHHRSRTADELRRDIEIPLGQLAEHGHLARDDGGRLRYAFIHGGWALANARADGQECGVDEELQLLFETGCYADFTFPSGGDRTQPRVVNQIYWPIGDLRRRRPFDIGERARVGTVKADRILMIEGPLVVGLRLRRQMLRIVADAIPGAPSAIPDRVATWVAADIHVRGRPEWVFVKVHTHGAQEQEASSLLGAGGRMLHETLTTLYDDGVNWSLHYVTAREMYNVVVAAMEGRSGDPAEYLDYRLPPPPAAV